ncbi:hypothetical protein SCP_1200590 [Sparassis crispa]|uniref:Uncharacterized protein n=1 Tax=Sparassis crispa TaxID=139825 RepID=A0A401H092_9APHY|nr:hypothetical protein SCP_1200590 [Sparassis crispa]GBE87834.1 hypothetical protein SCP_1200590 [Sparassis crispa]
MTICLAYQKNISDRRYRAHLGQCRKAYEYTASSIDKYEARGEKEKKAKLRKWDRTQNLDEECAALREVLNEVEDFESAGYAGEANDSMAVPPLIQEDPPDPSTISRAGRRCILPRRLVDYLPSNFGGLAAHILREKIPTKRSQKAHDAGIMDDAPPLPPDPEPAAEEIVPCFQTEPNQFGVYCEYITTPLADPEDEITLDSLCDSPTLITAWSSDSSHWNSLRSFGAAFMKKLHDAEQNYFAPFLNATTYHLISWLYNSSSVKSVADLDCLVNDVLHAEDFDIADLENFRAARELKQLDNYSEAFDAGDDWCEAAVKVHLPKENVLYRSEDDAPEFEVTGIYYRPLLQVIKAAYQDISATRFHVIPHKLFWQPPSSSNDASSSESASSDDDVEVEPEPVRIYSELYNSDAMLEEDAKLRTLPHNPDDSLDVEITIAPIMVWSDSTHLASFGTASLWPIYAYFGSLSKYFRGKLSAFAAHHLAYIPSLPDKIQDYYRSIYKVAAMAATLTFCKHERMQAIWLLLLDPEFMHAYKHGIILLCGDGVLRRLFPQFFTYSADYPEKVLLACIKYLAKCPCPRCLTKKANIGAIGTRAD